VDFGLAKRGVNLRQLSKAPQPRRGRLDLMVPLQMHDALRTTHPWRQTFGLHGSPALKQQGACVLLDQNGLVST
jgi:hypothetical protein